MSDIVNAEVVETREPARPRFPELWIVQITDSAKTYVVDYGQEKVARESLDVYCNSGAGARIIRIPAEGDEPMKRRAADRKAFDDWMWSKYGTTLRPNSEMLFHAWRAAEQHHGITGETKRPVATD